MLSLGLFSLFNSILYYFAFQKTTIANAVFTHYTAPIFVVFLAPLLIKEKIVRKTWITFPIALLGLFLIFFKSGLTFIHSTSPGILSGTASGLAYAFIIIIARSAAKSFSPYVISIYSNFLIIFLLLPFALLGHYSLTVSSILLILAMGLIHSTLAYIIYLQGLREVKAQEAAVLGYIEPVGAIILALLIFKEVPSGSAVIGGLLIILAGYLTTIRRFIR